MPQLPMPMPRRRACCHGTLMEGWEHLSLQDSCSGSQVGIGVVCVGACWRPHEVRKEHEAANLAVPWHAPHFVCPGNIPSGTSPKAYSGSLNFSPRLRCCADKLRSVCPCPAEICVGLLATHTISVSSPTVLKLDWGAEHPRFKHGSWSCWKGNSSVYLSHTHSHARAGETFPVKPKFSVAAKSCPPRDGHHRHGTQPPSHVSTDVMVWSPCVPARSVMVILPVALARRAAVLLPPHRGSAPAPSCSTMINHQVYVFTLCMRCFCWFLHSSRSARSSFHLA